MYRLANKKRRKEVGGIGRPPREREPPCPLADSAKKKKVEKVRTRKGGKTSA